MKKRITTLLILGFYLLLLGTSEVMAAKKPSFIENEDLYGSRPFFMFEPISNYFSWDQTYKLNYDLDSLRNQFGECVAGEPASKLAYAGRGSIYSVNKKHSKDDLVFIEFQYVAPSKKPPANVDRAEINKPYFLCKDKNLTSPNYYRQVGGVSTGVVIIPLKIRNDLTFSGDSTIGPYVGLSSENFTLMGVFGFTQLTIPVQANSDELETRTGLTAAFGINWKVRDFVNLGVVAGVDHVAGKAGDRFAYQDAPWVSFSMGYSFTD